MQNSLLKLSPIGQHHRTGNPQFSGVGTVYGLVIGPRHFFGAINTTISPVDSMYCDTLCIVTTVSQYIPYSEQPIPLQPYMVYPKHISSNCNTITRIVICSPKYTSIEDIGNFTRSLSAPTSAPKKLITTRPLPMNLCLCGY